MELRRGGILLGGDQGVEVRLLPGGAAEDQGDGLELRVAGDGAEIGGFAHAEWLRAGHSGAAVVPDSAGESLGLLCDKRSGGEEERGGGGEESLGEASCGHGDSLQGPLSLGFFALELRSAAGWTEASGQGGGSPFERDRAGESPLIDVRSRPPDYRRVAAGLPERDGKLEEFATGYLQLSSKGIDLSRTDAMRDSRVQGLDGAKSLQEGSE